MLALLACTGALLLPVKESKPPGKEAKPKLVLTVLRPLGVSMNPVQPSFALKLHYPNEDFYCPSLEWSIADPAGSSLGDRLYYEKHESDCLPWPEWLRENGKVVGIEKGELVVKAPEVIYFYKAPHILLTPFGKPWVMHVEARQGKKAMGAEARIQVGMPETLW